MKKLIQKTLIACSLAGLSTLAYSEGSHSGGHGHKDQGHHGGGGMMHGAGHFDEGMGPILKHYQSIHSALLAGKLDGVGKAADAIIASAKKLEPNKVVGEHASHYKHVPMNLIKAAEKIKSAKSVDEAREAFKKMSQPMAMWAGMAKPDGYEVKYCSMMKASWVQTKGKTKNPYYGHGHKMASCGESI